MKKHSTANILLVELVLVILFFMLCVSTLVEVSGLARKKSITARAENAAMLTTLDMDSRLCAAEDAAAELKENGFAQEGERWVLREKHYTLYVSEEEEKTEAGVLRTILFTAEQPDGSRLFELPTVKYFPGEVSP